jgi:spore germination protein KA
MPTIEESLYSTSTEVNNGNVSTVLSGNADFTSRVLLIRDNPDIPVTLCYMDGLVDTKVINNNILKPLVQEEQFDTCKAPEDAIRLISMGIIYSATVKLRTNLKSLVDDILGGSTAIIFNDAKTAFTFEVSSEPKRAISEPVGESVIKGARDSFVEALRTNTGICRKKIKSPNLSVEEITAGKQTKTVISIIYMKNITDKKLVDEVKKRLKAIDVDKVLTPGIIEELIIDDKYSSFPQIMYTERPDKFCTNIIEGRVGIIIEGVPTAYIVPGTLLQFIQSPDDYSFNFIIGSTIRFLRFVSMFITLVLPGFYISITSFHTEMLPAELAFSIVASREGVPFPMFIEVILLLLAFEILIEAGLRLPKTIGQTVSIVGALVVGQAAVEAKLLSPATVIIIAIAAIAGFTMPNQDFSNAMRLWRFIIVIMSSTIGIFGLTFGLILLLYHWCKMETFGVPYLDPFVANEDEQLQDTFFRLPTSTMKKRPSSLNTKNIKRME